MLRSTALASLLLGGCLLAAAPAGATTFTVVTTADSADASTEDGVCNGGGGVGGQCTLRAAIGQAQFTPGTDRIIVPAGTYQLLDGLGQLPVTSSVSIEGAGARTTTIKAADGSRVMLATGNLTLRDVGLTGGDLQSSGSVRGGGLNVAAGDVSLERVAVYGNTVSSATNAYGGGIGVEGGSLTVLDSTISGNTAVGRVGASSGGSAIGGGVSIGAPTVIRRSTVFGNTTRSYGAGQFSSGGGIQAGDETTLEHVTLVGNTAATVADSSGFRQGGNLYVVGSGQRIMSGSLLAGGTANNGANCFVASGALTVPAKNISTGDCTGATTAAAGTLQLGSLANNGGPTDTIRPVLGSAAINGAASCGTRTADQRGGPLPAGPACDLGAVEVGADRRITLQASKTAPAAGDDVTVIATITNDGPDDTAGETLTLDLPAGAAATTATSTLGTCTSGASVTCQVGTLADNAAATVIATVRATGAAGTIVAKRAGSVPDSAAANDTASVALTAAAAGPGTSGAGGTGGAAGQPGTPQGGESAIAPAITGLKLVRKPTLKKGAALSFTLSQAASVKVVTERLLPGRLSNGKCKASSKRGKRCKATKQTDERTASLAAGPAQVKIPGGRLRTGKVRITLVATSAAGVASAASAVEPTVKRR